MIGAPPALPPRPPGGVPPAGVPFRVAPDLPPAGQRRKTPAAGVHTKPKWGFSGDYGAHSRDHELGDPNPIYPKSLPLASHQVLQQISTMAPWAKTGQITCGRCCTIVRIHSLRIGLAGPDPGKTTPQDCKPCALNPRPIPESMTHRQTEKGAHNKSPRRQTRPQTPDPNIVGRQDARAAACRRDQMRSSSCLRFRRPFPTRQGT